jgi:hypothetical protein
MEKRQNKSDQNLSQDEVDNSSNFNFPKPAPRRKLFTSSIYNYPPHELSPCSSTWSGIDRMETSPDKDDSAYHTYHHHHHHHSHGPHTSSTTFSKSSSAASSDHFPSSESLRSSSPFQTSKPVHSHLIRIQLGGDDKKLSHEWYSEFQNQTHHHRAFANSPIVSSPLSNRSANTSSSEIEYDSHIALKRGNLRLL